MGYHFDSVENKFFIANDQVEHAFNALKLFAKEHTREVNNMRWISSRDILEADDFEECMNNLRWEIEKDENDNINNINFVGENLGDDLEIFNIISPYVKYGSYIECVDEDGDKWRYLFEHGVCREVYPKITWEGE